jgi:hypothetical protein
MVDFSKFVKSEKAAKERDPVQYEKDRTADARRMYKDADRFADSKLMERYDRMQKAKSGAGADADVEKNGKKSKGMFFFGESKGGTGKAAPFSPEGGMKPGQSPSLDNPINQAKGGKVTAYAKGGSVSARADGCAQRGKTKGRIV